MKAYEILNKAADLLETNGWCHGYYKDMDGNLCAAGATYEADHSGSVDADHVLLEYVSTQRDIPWPSVEAWNDTPGRTPEEVIEAMRAAAVIEQARTEKVEQSVS